MQYRFRKPTFPFIRHEKWRHSNSAYQRPNFEIIRHRTNGQAALLFPSPSNPDQPVCIRSAWETVVQRAGLKDFRFHDIRHTTASYLTMDGVSTREVAEILGHKSLQTTKRYSHLGNVHKRTLVNRMEEMINEKSD